MLESGTLADLRIIDNCDEATIDRLSVFYFFIPIPSLKL